MKTRGTASPGPKAVWPGRNFAVRKFRCGANAAAVHGSEWSRCKAPGGSPVSCSARNGRPRRSGGSVQILKPRASSAQWITRPHEAAKSTTFARKILVDRPRLGRSETDRGSCRRSRQRRTSVARPRIAASATGSMSQRTSLSSFEIRSRILYGFRGAKQPKYSPAGWR